ncbi:M23 family metallopeptidase [Vallitalea guaymasensis]|uniref:M23 family metallopeptidase n=1 Tax=Vallitalea guaymasensis TaxID=1185412 RepID=UPI00187D4DD5|nr:M23 family metallopeptidase [Vallitalea guaymasensis]
MAAIDNNFNMPLKSKYVITSEFGERIHPITKKKSFHHGIDLACPSGTNVYSATTGTVKDVVLDDKWLGNYVVVESFSSEHDVVYAHLRDIAVIKGTTVTGGKTPIGHVGSTGASTGPHLHFEVRYVINDVLKSYVNPRDVLDFNSATNVDEVEEATGEPTEGEGENKQLVYGLKLFCLEHVTGEIGLHVQGGYPKYDIYKSFNRKDWTFMGSSNTNLYTEYG